MTVTQRWGITIPLAGVPLMEHKEWLVELEDLGFTDVWSAETNGTDAFTPLVLAAVWAPSLRLGQAIVPVYTRGPALLAQSIATPSTARHRFVEQRHRRAMERHPVRAPVPTRP